MSYTIAEVYTKKEYECKCGSKIYYAKIADESGKLYTTDGNEPNGKFGKESNVLSGAVDTLVKDRLHSCTQRFVIEAIEKIKSGNTPGASTNKIDYFVCPPANTNEYLSEGLKVDKDTLLAYVHQAEQVMRELYPNLHEPNMKGQIRSRVVDQLLTIRLIRTQRSEN